MEIFNNAELLKAVVEMFGLLLCCFITGFAIPLIKAKIGNDRYYEMVSWIDIFVKAAEQMISEPGSGAKKKGLVTGWIKEKLAAYNIKMTDNEIECLIESFVCELNAAKED